MLTAFYEFLWTFRCTNEIFAVFEFYCIFAWTDSSLLILKGSNEKCKGLDQNSFSAWRFSTADTFSKIGDAICSPLKEHWIRIHEWTMRGEASNEPTGGLLFSIATFSAGHPARVGVVFVSGRTTMTMHAGARVQTIWSRFASRPDLPT